MARPKKDPSAASKPKVWEAVKLPVSPGRLVLVKYPVGGLTFNECLLLRRLLPVLMSADVDQEDFVFMSEDVDQEGFDELDASPPRRPV